MNAQRWRLVAMAAVLAAWCSAPAIGFWETAALAQNEEQQGGIHVEPDGVFSFRPDGFGRLSRLQREAAARSLPEDVQAESPLRKVSLVRLEEAVAEQLASGEPLPDEMQYLAGLQRIDYVFIYPAVEGEDGSPGDVVIAGPAEGWVEEPGDRVTGVRSGRPVLRLDDLVVALRAVMRDEVEAIECSIDPRPQGLADAQAFLAQRSGAVTPQQAALIYEQLARVVGMQDIRVDGVPDTSHFARVLVEADYRMKLIAMGLEQAGVRGLRTYFAMASGSGGASALQRWWFVPEYEPFLHNADRTAFAFQGPRMRLLSENEFVTRQGQRVAGGRADPATQRFAESFSEHFEELCAARPIFAELANATDLVVLAALLDRERAVEQTGWQPDLFFDANRFAVAEFIAPRETATIANYRRGRGGFVGMVAGGVEVEVSEFFVEEHFEQEVREELEPVRASALPGSPDRWWWD